MVQNSIFTAILEDITQNRPEQDLVRPSGLIAAVQHTTDDFGILEYLPWGFTWTVWDGCDTFYSPASTLVRMASNRFEASHSGSGR